MAEYAEIYDLIEFLNGDDEMRRNVLREEKIKRCRLRDASNAFDLPRGIFIQKYRLDQATVIELIESLRPHLDPPNRNDSISIEHQILNSLRFFAQRSYQQSTAQDYHHPVSRVSFCKILEKVVNAMNLHLLDVWIRFPTTDAAIDECKLRVYLKHGLSGVIGYVDGTKIKIFTPPSNNPEQPERIFVDRGGQHSLNAQMIFDSAFRILSVNARFPGSVHDSYIWKASQARAFLLELYRQGRRFIYMLGDSGYGMEPWLLTLVPQPQRENPLTPAEIEFNRRQMASRSDAERGIGILKTRFRCLIKDRVLHYLPAKAAKIVNACSILHNVALARNVELPEEELAIDEVVIVVPVAAPEDGEIREIGRQIRNEYIQRYFGHLNA